MKITDYHGATEIVKAPLCKIGRPRLDFGQGFYVTDLKEQAINWAQTLADKRNEKPLLNIYQLDKDAILAEARSKTCKQLHDKRTGLYLMSNGYVADDFILEMQGRS